MNSAETVAELARLLAQTDERASRSARLRHLLPYIQASVIAGLSYADVLHDLQQAGLPVAYRLLERSLYRWRKQQQANARQPPTTTTLSATPHPAAKVSPDAASVQEPSRRIKTPADLRHIRDMQVDLDALRREGEARRKGK